MSMYKDVAGALPDIPKYERGPSKEQLDAMQAELRKVLEASS